MKNLFEKIKANSLWMDFFNLFTGIILVIVIILFCVFPGNKTVIALMFLLTGAMNLSNGAKKYKSKSSRNMGMVLIMISVVTLVAGFMFLIKSG
ncbi:MAG: hypothetical protein ACERKN_03410 [Velocimicrobium sp.]